MVPVLFMAELMLDLLYLSQQVLEAHEVGDVEAIEGSCELQRLADEPVELDCGVARFEELRLLPPLMLSDWPSASTALNELTHP